MNSIQASLTELERYQQARSLAVDCYLSAIKNMAHYVVELDDALTVPHREYLNALASRVSASEPGALEESRATLRGLLRDYRDKASQYLHGLKEELAGTARALQETLDSLSQTDGDQETRLREVLGRLRDISKSAQEPAVRSALRGAAETIEDGLDQIRKQHLLTVSQFLTEIRVLHKRIDELETAASIDRLTQLFNRDEMEDRVRSASGCACCLLLLRVLGIRLVERNFSAPMAAELTGAFTGRLRNSLPPDTVIGRWGTEGFVAMLDLSAPEAMTRAKWIAVNLSGAYACLHKGRTVRPSLQISAGVIDTAGEAPERTLAHVAEFLNGA